MKVNTNEINFKRSQNTWSSSSHLKHFLLLTLAEFILTRTEDLDLSAIIPQIYFNTDTFGSPLRRELHRM